MRPIHVGVCLCLALVLCAAALSDAVQAHPEPAAGLQSQVYLPAVGKNGWPPPIPMPSEVLTPTQTATPTHTQTPTLASTPTAAATATPTPIPIALAPLSGLYGVIDHFDWGYTSQEQIEEACGLMCAAGIQWVRMDFLWGWLEPTNDQYQFQLYDRIVATLTRYGLRLLPILRSVPLWASSAPEELKQQYGGGWPVDSYPPADLNDWAEFVGKVVERYDGDGYLDAPGSPRIDYWQCWLSPNLSDNFQPQPNAPLYVQLLRRAHEAANTSDPNSQIVLGGLGGNGVFMGWEPPVSRYFLQAVYESGGKDFMDVVAIEPSVHPSSGILAAQSAVDDAKQVMYANGDADKPLWISAIGWSTAPNAWGNPTVTEEEVAGWLTTLYTHLRGVKKLFWSDFRDQGTDPENAVHHYGLVSYDLSPKPAYYAYQRFVAQHPFRITISPNMWEGFEYVCGHPPFTVDFSADLLGAQGALLYSWDLDGDGSPDSAAADPDSFVLPGSGVYTATLTVSDAAGKTASADRRIVVIGSPEWPSWKYGVTAHLNFDRLYTNTTQIQQAVDLIADAGIQVIRMDFHWGGIQPIRNYIDWRLYDDLVARLAQRDLEFLPLVNGCPQWAASLPEDPAWWDTPPRDPEEFGEFVFELVRRYREYVHAWEIRNEPNYDYYFRGYDPVVYAALLRQAYLATKYADPDAVVVFAGLALSPSPPWIGMSPESFLEQAYAAGARPYFDALALHPYTYPKDWIGPEVRLRGYLQVMRDVMTACGDAAKPIWITEIGWSNVYNPEGDCCTEEQVAAWLPNALAVLGSERDVGAVVWYNFRDKDPDPNDWERHYGLVRWDFSPKPAYYAYQQFIQEHPTPQ